MERKIDQELLEWILAAPEREASAVHKCLLLRGLRQTGKSYSIRKALSLPVDDLTVLVSSPKYPHWPETTAVEINLSLNPSFVDAFKGAKDAKTILSFLAQDPLLRGVDLSFSPTHRLLLFVDEIQVSSSAIEALKFLSYSRYLTVIASGSLLGLSSAGPEIFPTGYVDDKRLYPLDFEEFLWAAHYTPAFINSFVDSLALRHPLSPSLHEELLQRYREYLICGGLPECVKLYVDKGIHSPELFRTQRTLCLDYESDIAKYASRSEKLSASRIFSSIPNALAREKTRFVYALMGPGSSKSRYQSGLDWLLQSGLVYQAFNIEEPSSPLRGKMKEGDFKLYLADPGILWGLTGESSESLLLSDDRSYQKGMIFENGTADVLSELDLPSPKNLYYYGKENSFEIDFALEEKGRPLLIETKSSFNTRSKSLATVLKSDPSILGIRVSPKQIAQEGSLLSLPHYALPFLKRLVG